MTVTNIKNLPDGKYFTEVYFSEQRPWKEVKRTRTTVTLAAVYVDRDPAFEPHMIPGGFCGHCDNQQDQTWLFREISPIEHLTIRMTNTGWKYKGQKFFEDKATYFMDWNF